MPSITVKNIPEEIYDKVKERAAARGSLTMEEIRKAIEEGRE